MSKPAQTDQVSVKKATPADVSVIHELALASWEPTYKKILSKDQIQFMFQELLSEEALHKQMVIQQHIFYIQYQDDVATGFASYSLKEPIEKIYKLHRLYMRPESQKKGLGKNLLYFIEKTIALDGGTIMELNVNRKNGAKDFYLKKGYRVHQTVDIPFKQYWLNDYIMRKKLNKENYL